jgi:hypothetical protein
MKIGIALMAALLIVGCGKKESIVDPGSKPAEEIRIEAIKCKHCGSDLSTRTA